MSGDLECTNIPARTKPIDPFSEIEVDPSERSPATSGRGRAISEDSSASRSRTRDFLDRNMTREQPSSEYQDSEPDMEVDSEPHGLAGLRNLGNTCYMNSVLQVLAHTPVLASYFRTSRHLKEINKENFLGHRGELAIEFARCVEDLWKAGNKRAVYPRDIREKIQQLNPMFEGCDQQDAQELLAFLLDGLHEDLNRVHGKKPVIETPDITREKIEELGDERLAAEAWYNHLKRDKSFIVDLYQGQLKSEVKCSICGFLSVRYDPFMYLSLPVTRKDGTPVKDLDEALRVFNEEEILEGDEQFHCEVCKKKVDATKQMTIFKTPAILMLHLKRFAYDPVRGMSKLSFPISLPMTTSGPTTDTETSDEAENRYVFKRDDCVYILAATVDHIGSSHHYGHYVANIMHQSVNKWYCFDDDDVTEVKASDVNSHHNYILFFQQEKDYLGSDPSISLPRQSLSKPEFWPHKKTVGTWSFIAEEEVQALSPAVTERYSISPMHASPMTKTHRHTRSPNISFRMGPLVPNMPPLPDVSPDVCPDSIEEEQL